ncbi:MAG: ABC transporter ATP-binding protein, partial [Fimbriimonadales bacterium]
AIGAVIAVIAMSWQLALVSMLFVPVLAFVINRNGRKMKAASAQVQDDIANLIAMTTEALSGTRVVKAFNAEDQMRQSYRDHVEASYNSQMKAVARLASLRPLVELIGAVALAVVVYICGLLAVHTGFTVGKMAALIYALDVINQGFRTLGYANNTYNQVLAATDRMYNEVFDAPEDPVDASGTLEPESVQGRLEFRNVSFAYPDGTVALEDVSFVIEPGTSLALVGPSGAGKSTIADLLLRFYRPTSGQILLDGVDISTLSARWLRSHIGVVPQQTFLFAGSVADNIRMGAPDASNEEVAEAAKAAHADVFVERLPQRFDTVLGEQGTGLSGGERQRVAIARAIVRKPEILLLDEATSALDAESEKVVQEALEEIMRSRTTLFIAHRLTTAARADRILMLRRGKVLETGSHRELMEQGGAYATMYAAFTSGVMDGGA